MTNDEKRVEALKLAIECVGGPSMSYGYITEVALSFYQFLMFERSETPIEPRKPEAGKSARGPLQPAYPDFQALVSQRVRASDGTVGTVPIR